MKIQAKALSKLTYLSSTILLLIMGFLCLHIFADTDSGIVTPLPNARAANSPLMSTSTPSLSISSDPNITMTVSPTILSGIGTTDSIVTVNTNNPTGYKLTLSSNDEDNYLCHSSEVSGGGVLVVLT